MPDANTNEHPGSRTDVRKFFVLCPQPRRSNHVSQCPRRHIQNIPFYFSGIHNVQPYGVEYRREER